MFAAHALTACHGLGLRTSRPEVVFSLEEESLVDETVPSASPRRFKSFMVLPPGGTDRGQSAALAEVERVLLSVGARVISPGYTARVVKDAASDRVEGASQLSDLERALVLARESNAEALVQIADMRWEPGRRIFATLEDGTIAEATHGTVNPRRAVLVKDSTFEFRARVIDVQNGEIVMSLRLRQSTSKARTRTVSVMMTAHGMDPDVISLVGPESRSAVLQQVYARLVERVAQPASAASRAPRTKYEVPKEAPQAPMPLGSFE